MGKQVNNSISISIKSNNPTIAFSASELKKYLNKAKNGIAQEITESVPSSGVIQLGLYSDFGITPDVKDEYFDDSYKISINDGTGYIAGVNPRSVLLGVYRFLYELGYRWIRPGEDGEIIPELSEKAFTVNLESTPSYRHRGICIEGAVSYENVYDVIDWAPKLGFNSYFIQFREAYAFFERWYNHLKNPYKTPEGFSIEKSKEIVRSLEGEIKKRGLLYHAVGHGWTCEPFGIPGLSWSQCVNEVDPEIEKYLALVNGKRRIWGGVPLNTNLCYSNPEVRKIVINSIADYLTQHKDIDILHFWLADGHNNQCECENCIKHSPSDFYVLMLNELDELLTKKGIYAKVVFLLYCELLWPPEEFKINNPNRYILMFAPITRTYSVSFSTDNIPDTIPEYKRNNISFPSSVAENLAFLYKWREGFNGDSFDFDYHFMWDHYYDPGQFETGRILNEDVKKLESVGLNGFVSCQVQRCFFPNGLGMTVLGRTLWDKSLAFEDIAEEYFRDAYGKDWDKAKEYLGRLSAMFNPPLLRGDANRSDKAALETYRQIEGFVKSFEPVIKSNLNNSNKTLAKSWEYLDFHKDFCIMYSKVIEARLAGDIEKTRAEWAKLKDFLCRNEDRIQPVFDIYEFFETFDIMTTWLLDR